ncbi:MAG: hypothetical protein VW886_02590 [Candidatus Heimdallarchaeota archaeon]|jgi:hypothetical protein|tara:strand:- start:75 stop:467 length:393 start_codon:yes stop_codon:yes gene_type:complete
MTESVSISEAKEVAEYYFSLAWWLLKWLILILIFIPGSVPLMIGYFVTWIYVLIDPELVGVNYVIDLYETYIDQLSLFVKILIITVFGGIILFIYDYWMYRKYPDLTWKEIMESQWKTLKRKLRKPQKST